MYRLISLNRARLQTPIPMVFLLFSASQDHRSLVAKPASVHESLRCECLLSMRECVRCPKSEVHHRPTVNKAYHAAAWAQCFHTKFTKYLHGHLLLTRTQHTSPPTYPLATPRPKGPPHFQHLAKCHSIFPRILCFFSNPRVCEPNTTYAHPSSAQTSAPVQASIC